MKLFSLRNKFITGFCLLILLIVSAQFLFGITGLNRTWGAT